MSSVGVKLRAARIYEGELAIESSTEEDRRAVLRNFETAFATQAERRARYKALGEQALRRNQEIINNDDKSEI
jgi:hypothetical protein